MEFPVALQELSKASAWAALDGPEAVGDGTPGAAAALQSPSVYAVLGSVVHGYNLGSHPLHLVFDYPLFTTVALTQAAAMSAGLKEVEAEQARESRQLAAQADQVRLGRIGEARERVLEQHAANSREFRVHYELGMYRF